MEKPVDTSSVHRTLGVDAADRLAAVRIVLVAPSHPGNIGSTARAMATMGLSDLVVVAPRFDDFRAHEEARAFAGHGLDRLEQAVTAPTLEVALADCQLVIGVSAEAREFGPEPRRPGPTVREAFAWLSSGRATRVAFVFGTERTGLSIREAGLCQRLTSIPADPQRSSLNLAQAVQIIAFSLREAALDSEETERAGTPGSAMAGSHLGQRLADHAAIEGFYRHLEAAMVACGFLDPGMPKRLMPRMRRLFGRTGLDVEEVDLLRGFCTRIERTAAGLPGRRRPRGEAARGEAERGVTGD